MRRIARIGVILALLVPTAAYAECSTLIPVDVQSSIQARVDSGINAGIVVGVIAACGNSFYGYGSMTDSGDTSVDEHTLFEIGSATKPFTALLLAEAVEQGELSLYDEIDDFLPATVSPPRLGPRSIQLQQLATHTSGLPPIPENLDPVDWNNPYADYTVEQLYEFISDYRVYGLGSYTYSNLGMGLLGHILELHFGASYESLVIERIANVLGMQDTRVTLTDEQIQRTATGYREGEAFPIWANPTLAGAGCLLSTASDLATFVAANLGLLDSPLLAAMQMTHQERIPGNMPVGLAWHMRKTEGKTIVEHHGATGGCWSYIGFVIEDQMGVVVLTNTYADVDDIGIHILDSAIPLSMP
ncbi:serine hydrolase [Candidatus Bipolaricaulota bacterium]|nr:serine hydrolase [Candidatus Bipolaricaulota bacterium]